MIGGNRTINQRAKSWWVKSEDGLKILAIVVLIVAFVRVGCYLHYTDNLKLVHPSFCPDPESRQQKNEGIVIPGHTAILIDTSNNIPAADTSAAFRVIDRWAREEAPRYQKVRFFLLPAVAGGQIISPPDSLCVPKRSEEFNPVHENPRFLRAKFDQFSATLDTIFQDMVSQDEADKSPIVETMAGLVEQDSHLTSIIMISDMLQNTALWSSYTKQGDGPAIASECNRIKQGDQLETVYVYYIDRQRDVQPRTWPDQWWSDCLSGVNTVKLN